MRERHPLAVVVPYWLDRPALEALEVVHAADAAGIEAVWMGEMLSFDAFALAGAVARETHLHITVGPLGVGIRTPVGIAMGVASLQALAGPLRVALALGSSTRVVTEDWHGRPWVDLPQRIAETARIVRSILAGEKAETGEIQRTTGFRLGIPATVPEIGVAAFGPRTTKVAVEHGDRLVLNLVTVAQAEVQAGLVPDGMPVTAWVVAALEPSPEGLDQMRRQVAMYLGAPGYGEMFEQAGFGQLVQRARSGDAHSALVESVPNELLEAVAAVGSRDDVARRLGDYRGAGVTQVAVVPVTAGDPAGSRTLRAVAGMA